MKEIEISSKKLLAAVQANRDKHSETVGKALKVFNDQVIAWLERLKKDILAGKRVVPVFQGQVPMDMTREYDSAIKALEMTDKKVVILSQKEFDELVMDRWSWKDSFTATNLRYLSSDEAER